MKAIRLLVLLSSAVAFLALAGCAGRDRSNTVTIKGSDTMVILGQRWAEDYMASHEGTVIQVTGGGSGTGIAALINGTTDICQASRQMKDEERTQLEEAFGSPGHEITVARDGVAVYLHEENPITSLSLPQLRAIYSGAVTNWKEVGGPDRPITVYGRENSSGTYEYFKKVAMGGDDFAPAVQTLPGTAAVVNAVAQDAGGIGYGGAAYAKGVRECAVSAEDGGEGVLPTRETVSNDTYPIARELYYYTRKAPEGAVKAFIDYALSAEGQAVVSDVGYFPVN